MNAIIGHVELGLSWVWKRSPKPLLARQRVDVLRLYGEKNGERGKFELPDR
jgi:hypothetical protein